MTCSTGFTLLEILISLFLLSLILLGLDAMQIYALRENRAAFYFLTAENQIDAMIERLYALNTQENLAEQINIWNQQNQEVLPLGKGSVSGYFPSYTLKIEWDTKYTIKKQVNL